MHTPYIYMKTAGSKRLLAIDLFRAVTMLLMIFVNDVAGVQHVPGWLGHTQAQEDGMGFADSIFPAFLFIVGLSLPLAIGKRITAGQSFIQITGYILLRSAALILMGFFHVNLENYNSDVAVLSQPVWALAITVAFFLVWLDYPSSFSPAKKYLFQSLGIAILLLMAFLYKGGTAAQPTGMRPHWWGILGIIGWAYGIAALVFLLARGKLPIVLAATIIFLGVNIAAHTGHLPFSIPILGDASSVSLIMLGVVTSILYSRLALSNRYRSIWILFSLSAAVLAAAGFIIRPYAGGISKIMATPAWVLICTAISLAAFELFIWLADIRGKQNWFRLIKPAGTSTLTCYLLPYILYAVYTLAGFRYPSFLNDGAGGILRSFAVAFIIILVAGQLEKVKIRLNV